MNRIGAFFLASLCALCGVSCKGKDCGGVSGVSADRLSEAAAFSYGDPADFGGLFNLDYTPEEPEDEMVPGRIGTDYASSSGQSGNFIPGLRSLDKYKTAYQTKRLSLAEYLKGVPGKKAKGEVRFADGAAQSAAGDFRVVGWGPQGEIPGELDKAEFYVEFSLPVKALSALRDQDEINAEGARVMRIEPEVKGNYRWLGTKTLSFDAEEPLSPAVPYRITVNASLVSESGAALTGETAFTARAADAQLVSLLGGAKADGTVERTDSSGFSREQAKYAYLLTNCYLTAEEMRGMLAVTQNDSALRFTVAGDFGRSGGATRVTNDGSRATGFFVVITDEIASASVIKFTITNTPSGKKYARSYNTVYPLELSAHRQSTSRYGFEYEFRFNNEISAASARRAFSSADVPIGEENVVTSGRTVLVKNLAMKPGQRATIVMSGEISDVFGSKLGRSVTVDAVGTDYYGRAAFLDYGNKILESQFPHKLLFEYMNAREGSFYRVGKTDNPLDDSFHGDGFGERFELDVSQKNVRQFAEIDLDPYLTDGKGAVHFESELQTLGFRYDGERRWDEHRNTLTVQVTDLAATVRLGVNRAVLMVRRLSTGEPVEGAEVTVENGDLGSVSSVARTDSGGYAALPFNFSGFFVKYADARKNVFVRVKADGDEVVFVPSTHNSWSSGVYPSSLFEVLKPKEKTFIFSDRGLYKPGETITFKGIDRDLDMGSFRAYNGEYSVAFEKYDWRDPKVYGTLAGKTSASGGFDGSFDIPGDLAPGDYRLTYRRAIADGTPEGHTLYFTVAHFEPLKIQAELSVDSREVVAGDIVAADFKASYLAGGALSDADYETTWYSAGTRFTSDAPSLKGYTFGIADDYEPRRVVAEESGTLSSAGKSRFSCATGGLLKPIPYEFRVETYVTDESNQRISASARKIVHPAEFYIGIGAPVNQRGFAKKGEAVELPFAVVSLDGAAMKPSDFPKEFMSSQLTCTLSRRYWTYDYQKAAGGGVYAKYTEHEDVESASAVKFAASGKIKVTPKEAGYYTLRVEGKDQKGRPVVSDYRFYVTGSGAVWGGGELAINLTCDAPMYNPGDTASILMESPLASGDYLVTVEREGIFTQEMRHIDEPTSVLEVKIARNYVPVVYVSVSSYSVRSGQPTHEYGQVDLDKPKGIYGVTPVFINPRVKAFSVKVETDKKIYRPGDTATVTLTATKGGKPVEGAELTAMACDRAVLDLINYHVPDPIAFFYDRWNFPQYCYGGDSRDYLMDPVTYSVKNLQGGDADGGKDGGNERREFKPTAFFEPLLVTDKKGTVSFTFKVPDNLTTFRLTAFGVKDELLALQESEFGTQNPINVQAVQPRRLRERDTAECGVVLTNLDSVPHEVSVGVQVRKPASAAEGDDGLFERAGGAFIDGAASCKVKVAAGGTSVAYFDVVAQAEGFVELVYTVTSDVLNEKLVSKIRVEKPYILEKTTLSGSTEGAATERLVIPSFADGGLGSLDVSFDASQLGLFNEAVKYVFHYPYGCMEQQSAAVLPLVIFSKYIEPLGMGSEVADAKKVLKAHFKKWKKAQCADGGFPYWPDDTSSPDFFVSLRIAHIYALAMKSGFRPGDFPIDIARLKGYIEKNVGRERAGIEAYACYVFSLLGDSALDGVLGGIADEAKRDLTAASYAGLAWLNKGGAQAANADGYHALVRSHLRPALRSVDVTQPAGDGSYGSSYYASYVAQKAVIMQFFVEYDAKDEMVDRLLNALLLEQAYGGYWENTATTARVLEAVRSLIEGRSLEATDFSAKCDVLKKSLLEEKFKGLTAKRASRTVEFSSDFLKNVPRDEEIPLEFSKKGTGTLYYTATLSYALPSEIQSARNEGFSVRCTVRDYKTDAVVSPANLVMALESGKTYKMQVEISSEKERTYTAVRVPIPSGCEILDSRFATSGSEAQISTGSGWYSSTAILDNEAQFFFNHFAKGTRSIEFTFRAARRGVYPLVPVLAECMYEPEIFGRGDGLICTIR